MPLNPKDMKAYANSKGGGGKQPFQPRKPGEAHSPPPKGGDGGGQQHDQKNGGKEPDFGGDNSHETMFSELENEFPEVAEMLEDLADAHESKDEKQIEEAVGKLLDFLSGHGLEKHKGDGDGEDKKKDEHPEGGEDDDEDDDE
jgi:hypothetical protein